MKMPSNYINTWDPFVRKWSWWCQRWCHSPGGEAARSSIPWRTPAAGGVSSRLATSLAHRGTASSSLPWPPLHFRFAIGQYERTSVVNMHGSACVSVYLCKIVCASVSVRVLRMVFVPVLPHMLHLELFHSYSNMTASDSISKTLIFFHYLWI